jgi:hypothetical protein
MFAKLLEAQTDCCPILFYLKVYRHLRQFFSAVGASAVVALNDFVGGFQLFSIIENEFAFLTDRLQRHQSPNKKEPLPITRTRIIWGLGQHVQACLLFLGVDSHHHSNCFAAMFLFTLYCYSFSVFTYPHDFARVSIFWMKLLAHWNLHLVSNFNFCYQRFLLNM